MKKELVAMMIFLSFFSLSIEAQVTNHLNFLNSKWATRYKDSFLLKNDTLKIVNISNENVQSTDSVNISSFFGNNDFMTLVFKKHKKLEISVTQINSWSVLNIKGDYKWKFRKKRQTLYLYNKKKLIGSFIILSSRNVVIKSNYIDRSNIETQELVLKREPIR